MNVRLAHRPGKLPRMVAKAGKSKIGRPALSVRPLSPGGRLRELREKAGLNQEQLAAELAVSRTRVTRYERGEAIPVEVARRAGDRFRVNPSLFLLEEVASRGDFQGFPLVGMVGAGGEGDYEDDYAKGAARDYVEPLPGMQVDEDMIVVQIDGESMMPAVYPGDLVFFGPKREDVDAFINQRVMARLKSGKKFFKLLKRGSEPGTFTLRSFNPATPDIEDVEIAWVLPYRGSKPRDA